MITYITDNILEKQRFHLEDLQDVLDIKVITVNEFKSGKKLLPNSQVVVFGHKDKIKYNARNIQVVFCETGFIYDSFHMDFVGLFDKSALNRPNTDELLFKNQKSWWTNGLENYKESCKANISKYKQPTETVEDEGYILIAAQLAIDSQIVKLNDPVYNNDYYLFAESIMKKAQQLGKKVFIKQHPRHPDRKLRDMANSYGFDVKNVSVASAIQKCERVVVFNSTLAVDAMVYDKPIFVMAPGYWGGLNKCISQNRQTNPQEAAEWALTDNGTFSRPHRDLILGFLINEYCIKIGDLENFANKLKAGPRFWEL